MLRKILIISKVRSHDGGEVLAAHCADLCAIEVAPPEPFIRRTMLFTMIFHSAE